MQEGPSSTPHGQCCSKYISCTISNSRMITSLAFIWCEESEPDVVTRPFIHAVELKGERKIPVKIKGLFDDGALVNAICKMTFPSLKRVLGEPTPSTRTLQMADGTHVPSSGRWFGDITIGDWMLKTWFEIFPSGGGWSLLIGKPLLKKFKALHDYERDILMIPANSIWTMLTNEVHMEDSDVSLWGNDDSPLRQVTSSIVHSIVPFDKHHPPISIFQTASTIHKLAEGNVKRKQGRQARNKQKTG